MIGRRRGYYSDNGEDAVIMWSDSIHAPRFKRNLHRMIEGIAGSEVSATASAEYPER